MPVVEITESLPVVTENPNPPVVSIVRRGRTGPAGTDGADGADGTDGIGVPDATGQSAGLVPQTDGADGYVLGAAGGDPVLAKVPDLSVLANSPSIWYPEEDDANEAALTALGYAPLGGGNYSIVDGAFQFDSSAAGGAYQGAMVPMVANAGEDFNVIFVFEPSARLTPPTDATSGTGNDGQLYFFGIADTVADIFYFAKRHGSTNGHYAYYSSSAGTASTGVVGGTLTKNIQSDSLVWRVQRRSGVIQFARMDMGIGWQPVQRQGWGDQFVNDDGWFLIGAVTFANAVSHACVGVPYDYPGPHRLRLRSIWRAQ